MKNKRIKRLLGITLFLLSIVVAVSLVVLLSIYLKEKKEQASLPEKYSVTFDANGGIFESGGTVYSSECEQGKISAPRTPEKEGYVLDGWATDRQGTNIWYFESREIRKDTYLYAVWVDAVNLTFDADGGVFSDGSESFNAKVGKNKTLSVEVPKFEGFNFVGWFNGDTRWNGVAERDMTLQAVWEYRDEAVLATPTSISYDEKGIRWGEVKNAKGYKLTVCDLESKVELTVLTLEKPYYDFPSGFAAGEYRIIIIALGDGENTVNSGERIFDFAYKQVKTPEAYYDTKTNTLHWRAVEGATYTLTVGGEVAYEGEELSFCLKNYQAGEYKTSLTASAEGLVTSKEFNLTVFIKKLKAPDSINVFLDETRENIIISWTPSKCADEYELIFASGTETVKTPYISMPINSEYWQEKILKFNIRAKDTTCQYLKSDLSQSFEIENDLQDVPQLPDAQ